MEKLCAICRSPRVESTCGICAAPLCRKCRIFLEEDAFELAEGPRHAELKHSYYCGSCYDEKVEPFKTEYEATLEQAKAVNVIFAGSKSHIRVIRKAIRAIEIKGSRDRDETILKLAFQAARAGYNSLIDVEISSQKLRNQGWQTSTWTGRGIPAEILVRQEF